MTLIRPAELKPTGETDFLLLAGDGPQLPVMVGRQEIRLLNRIDGRRSLWDVLKKVEKSAMKRAFAFIGFLVQNQMIDFS